MGLRTSIIDDELITTTPKNIISEFNNTLVYHHINLFFTGDFGSTDRYQIIVMKYDPVATGYVRQYEDEVNYESAGNTATGANQNKAWEMIPTPGLGMKLVITKIAGADRTVNYEIIQAT